MTSRPNTEKRYSQALFRATITLILTALGSWAVYHHWPLPRIDHIDDTPLAHADRLRDGYPAAHFARGMQAWHQQQPASAADSFRRAVALDVLFFDAWIKLAEAEAAMGHVDKAKDILEFTTGMTDRVYRYLWPQMLLAHELGVNGPVYDGVNCLLSNKVIVQDALQLLHTHLDNDAAAVVAVLAPAHLPAYLDWTMRWGMPDASQVVWRAMTANAAPDREIALRYAHFLLTHKKIIPSVAIWRDYTGNLGLTNPGFESEITGQGFDWRHWGNRDGKWEIKRIGGQTADGDYALRIDFAGHDNIAFEHLFQIFTVTPGARYRLAYAWQSRSITSDQGPFVEVFSYDVKGLYQAGPMLTGNHKWHEASIEFKAPETCHAAVVRLRRRQSMRFDNKIRGTLWIDHFQLHQIESGAQAAGAVPRIRSHRSES
jgi:hypothetical protein